MLCRERKSQSTGKISAVVMAACGAPAAASGLAVKGSHSALQAHV